jgi:hypothetical protein
VDAIGDRHVVYPYRQIKLAKAETEARTPILNGKCMLCIGGPLRARAEINSGPVFVYSFWVKETVEKRTYCNVTIELDISLIPFKHVFLLFKP